MENIKFKKLLVAADRSVTVYVNTNTIIVLP